MLAACGSSEHEDDVELSFGEPLNVSSYPIAGQPFSLRFTIRNRGGMQANNVRWRLLRNGVFIGGGTVVNLFASSESPLQGLTITEYEGGDHYYEVLLDPFNEFREYDESDNRALIIVNVAPNGVG